MEWLPIETAPKDGRWFFVWHEASCLPVMCRWEPRGFISYSDYRVHAIKDKETFSSERWMPLPEPPK